MIRLLVLDDMPAIGRMFDEIAVEFEFGVRITTTPDEFKVVLAEYEPNLVVLDMVFPGGDGLQILRFLEAAHYRGALIIVSGLDDRLLTAAHGLAIGLGLDVIGAIRKPFRARTIRELFAKIAARDPIFASSDFRAALTNSEITLHYQPIVDMKSREVLSVEALIRWAHPEHGLRMPDEFLPVAAREGLMYAVTVAVLDIAVADARRLKQYSVDLGVAIKMPAEVVLAPTFLNEIDRAITGVDSYRPRVTIALTETEATAQSSRILEIAAKLRDRGVELAIDDFGTGYSSLLELRRLPISRIKIDKSLVIDCARDGDALAITRAAIQLSHTLGMTAVAEGVESPVVWDRLLEYGCDAVQGYFIARPMPGPELRGWLDQWRQDTADYAPRSGFRTARTLPN
jgi:EAL domain-containing protein (putative c-di-GMP-specific phosphodiesterase class I)/CheY-like chemotaxis protein